MTTATTPAARRCQQRGCWHCDECPQCARTYNQQGGLHCDECQQCQQCQQCGCRPCCPCPEPFFSSLSLFCRFTFSAQVPLAAKSKLWCVVNELPSPSLNVSSTVLSSFVLFIVVQFDHSFLKKKHTVTSLSLGLRLFYLATKINNQQTS